MTEREQLLEEASALGLSFAKNAKTSTIQKAVDQAKNEVKVQDAIEKAGGEPIARVIPPTEAEIRAQIEAEFKTKLEAQMRKVPMSNEKDVISWWYKMPDGMNEQVTNQLYASIIN